jgi:uncharacterized protein (TIGR02453 family)
VAFNGWPAEAIEFYVGLEADNSKPWWQEHKAAYEDAVRTPMELLLDELAPEFGDGKVFRPYRDVRFSKDKTPYKTACAATLANGGYIQFSATGLSVGRGLYRPAPDQLERFRKAVADDRTGPQLLEIIASTGTKGIDVHARESLKTAPRGYAKDHPRIGLLRQKGVVAWREWKPAAWLHTAKAKDRIVDFFRDSEPLNDWLADHVGESHLPDHGRRG